MKQASAQGIVCFAGNDWWLHNPLTEKHWMKHLSSQGYRILYVNSIGIGLPSMSSPKALPRMWRKLKSMLRWLRKTDEGIWVLTPFVIPLWSVKPIASLNTMLLTIQLRFLMRLMGMDNPVFWAGLPTPAIVLKRIPHSSTVYYIQDNYTAYYDAMSFSRTQEHHDTMIREADAVICASIGMAELLEGRNNNIIYIPHGVASGFLSKDVSVPHDVPSELQGIPKPLIGYWGSLEALQDQELVAYLAARHPDWSLVFIGREMYDTSKLRLFPNIHFCGFVPLERIPDYGVHFDLGMMCFVQSEWIRYSCPIKYREYLALGLPVVSSSIIEVQRAYPDAARTASTHEEFCTAIEEELACDTPEKHTLRRKLVEKETWALSAERVMEVLGLLANPGQKGNISSRKDAKAQGDI